MKILTSWKVVAALWLIAAAFIVTQGKAAEITTSYTEFGDPYVVYFGPVVVADYDNLKAVLDETHAKKIVLVSPGGVAFTGYRLGALLSEYEMTAYVPKGYTCISACALAFLGASDYKLEGVLAFHTAYINDVDINLGMLSSGDYARNMQLMGAVLYDYLISNGFSSYLAINIILRTDPNTFITFTTTEELLAWYVREDYDAVTNYLEDPDGGAFTIQTGEEIWETLREQSGLTDGEVR